MPTDAELADLLRWMDLQPTLSLFFDKGDESVGQFSTWVVTKDLPDVGTAVVLHEVVAADGSLWATLAAARARLALKT